MIFIIYNELIYNIYRSLLDKYKIKVLRKGQFTIFMHILESCKGGDAIPTSLPFSIIQSVCATQEMEDRTVPSNYIYRNY